MRCSSLSRFSFLSVAPNTAMSSRPHFRGGGRSNRSGVSDLLQNRARGRGRGRQIVTGGDAHLHSPQDQNQVHRHGAFDNRAGFHSRPFNPRTAPHNQHAQFRYPPPDAQIRQAFQAPQHQGPQHRSRPEKPLDYRNWEYAKRAKAPPSSERFVVLSYNILADYLAFDHRGKLYFHIPRYMLDWQWRKKNIIFELGLWSADIMCFQEVDRFNDLELELKRRGYLGIWKMRTGNPVDGCAIFWRTSRFKLVHEESIEFNKLGLRDNVAQICVLELTSGTNTKNSAAQSLTSSKNANKVVICNIHVLYNPRRGEIKLGQVRVLLDRAHAVSKLWGDAPLVLCGDFNCTPKSPLYNYISERKIDLSEVDRDKVSGQASAEIRPQRQYNHNSRNQPADSSIQPPSASDGREVGIDKVDQSNKEVQKFIPPASSPHTEDVLASHLNHGSPNISECSPDSTSIKDSLNSSINSSDQLCKSEVFDSTEINSHSSLENLSPRSNCDSEQGCSSISYEVDIFNETAASSSLHEQYGDKIEGGSIGEDAETFLSALHENEDAQLQSPSYEVLNGFSSGLDSEATGYRTSYDPSMWTRVEIETATGKPDCRVLEHPVKLRSTYTEVEDCSGTRDSSGEPLATSYNRCFLGTVDYIWCSEGLQTVRVLAPIPKQAMQQTPGYPTKKWGSDHIALASELVFVKKDQL